MLDDDKGCVKIKNLTTTPPPTTTTSTATTLLWYWCQMHRDIVGGNVKNEKRSQKQTWPKLYSIWVILCIVRRAEISNRQAGEAKDKWEAAKTRKIHRLRWSQTNQFMSPTQWGAPVKHLHHNNPRAPRPVHVRTTFIGLYNKLEETRDTKTLVITRLNWESFQKSPAVPRESRKSGVKGGSWEEGGGSVGRTPARWSRFSVVSAHLLQRKISGLGAERQQSSSVRCPTGDRLFGNYLSPTAASEDRPEADARGASVRGHFYLWHALQHLSPEKKTL